MKLADFQSIAKYLNEINRNCFTQEEVNQYALDYNIEYIRSLMLNKPTIVMYELCKLLVEDMDYLDYEDLNNELDIETMQKILKDFIKEI